MHDGTIQGPHEARNGFRDGQRGKDEQKSMKSKKFQEAGTRCPVYAEAVRVRDLQNVKSGN
jgi:hypothetical protein